MDHVGTERTGDTTPREKDAILPPRNLVANLRPVGQNFAWDAVTLDRQSFLQRNGGEWGTER